MKFYLLIISLELLFVYAISCGVNTVFYFNNYCAVWAQNLWQKILLWVSLGLIFFSGFALNFILYFKNISNFFVKEKEESSKNISNFFVKEKEESSEESSEEPSEESTALPAKFIGIIIAIVASATTGLFSYYSALNCPLGLHEFIVYLLPIAAGVVTFALLAKDTIKMVDNLFKKKDKSTSSKREYAKILLTIVFLIATLGLIITTWDALIALKIPIPIVICLIVGLTVSEISFIYGSACEVVASCRDVSFKKSLGFLSFCLLAAAINGVANGVLDANSFTGKFGLIMAICGTILSLCLMMNAIVRKSKSDGGSYSAAQLFESIKTVMPTAKQMASGISALLSMSAIILMLQFNVPSIAIWLPIMILLNLSSSVSFSYCSIQHAESKTLQHAESKTVFKRLMETFTYFSDHEVSQVKNPKI